ncbi:MAG: sigma-70 family RNA polymerase sigma factor [Steroidobacteraceae bacterium]
MLLTCQLLAHVLPLAGAVMSVGLLARIAQGEQAAFKQCIEQYGGMIWGLSRKLSSSTSDAEDATQDVFLHLWKNAKHFDASRGSEAIFIVTLTRRTLISRLRGKQRRPNEVSIDELGETNWEPSVVAGNEDQVEASIAAQALSSLPAEQQRVIRLSVVEGLSQSEIATHTGLPLGTVKTMMRRGLILVREKLGLASASGTEGRS